jgi:cobalt/nickel transport protein
VRVRRWAKASALLGWLVLLGAGFARAHFLVVIPSAADVAAGEPHALSLSVRFAHPFEAQLLDLAPPRRAVVQAPDGAQRALELSELRAASGERSYRARLRVERPGDHWIFVEAEPYWEAAEGRFLLQTAKVAVHAHGLERGWERPLGLRAEIVPLTRPYGLWTGSLFSAQVLLDGRPVAHARVELAYDNAERALRAPSAAHATQVLRSGADGVFSCTLPRAGWWGIAAVIEGVAEHPGPDGEPRPAELGAVLWVRAEDVR